MSTPSRPCDTHAIHVKNLQLPAGVKAPDIWGSDKVQPALISAELVLRTDFNTAATEDALDESTIHYGHLCKEIRSRCSEPLSIGSTLGQTVDAILRLATGPRGCILSTIRLTLRLPKASVYGKEIQISVVEDLDGNCAQPNVTISYVEVQIMTVVGINEQERTGKQALIVTCDLVPSSISFLDMWLTFERRLVAMIEPFTFGTLEALAVESMQKVQEQLADINGPPQIKEIRILFEKPSAVVFADAPAIEIRRKF